MALRLAAAGVDADHNPSQLLLECSSGRCIVRKNEGKIGKLRRKIGNETQEIYFGMALTLLTAVYAHAQETPPDVRDLIGVKGTSGESQLRNRDYSFVRYRVSLKQT
jgi:hypothetical protein